MSAFIFTLCTPTHSWSAEIQFDDACTISEKVDLFGTGTVDFKVAKGALYSQKGEENGAPQFCGPASQHTPPFGWIDVEHCVATSGTELVPFPHSNKLVKSDCRVSDPNKFTTPYRDEDFAPWQGKGMANLHGQAFMKTVGGDVKTCAGEDVYLLPANAYVDQIVTRHSNEPAKIDPRASSQFRHTICDAQGNFSFPSVPTGKWYVDTQVVWGIPHIEQPGEQPGPLAALLLGVPPPRTTDKQGGELLKEIALDAGDNQVFLTDRDLR
jgi:hypothetical protein